MSQQHKGLALGRWNKLSFFEQMANIGSEVERALNWQAKGNVDYSRQAIERAFELIDLTLNNCLKETRIRELTLVRGAMVDYFLGKNEFNSSEVSWKNYFLPFVYAARRKY